MFNLSCKITNPWCKRKFKNVFCKHGVLSKNKAWEIEFIRHNSILELSLEWYMHQDHAGVSLALALAGYEIHMQIYDMRHWDYNLHRWGTHETHAG